MKKFWTKKGLETLGSLIRRSREDRGLSLRQAAEIVEACLDSSCSIRTIDHGTLSRIEKGHGEPRYNSLAAIAAAGIVLDSNGNALNIYDFINIASESCCASMTFKELIQYELDRRGWTLRQFAADNELDYEDLAEIFDGQPPQEYLILGLATQLTNPTTGNHFVYAQEIMDFCRLTPCVERSRNSSHRESSNQSGNGTNALG